MLWPAPRYVATDDIKLLVAARRETSEAEFLASMRERVAPKPGYPWIFRFGGFFFFGFAPFDRSATPKAASAQSRNSSGSS